MNFYNKDYSKNSFSINESELYELSPDWDYWKRLPYVSLTELVSLSLGIDPKIDIHIRYNELLDWAHREWQEAESYLSDLTSAPLPLVIYEEYVEQQKNANSKIEEFEHIKEILSSSKNDLENLAKSHVDAGILPVQEESQNQWYSLKVCDFVDWLNEQAIPYPEELNTCLIPIKENEEVELSPSNKSSYTQENTMLKRLFNSMVQLHYNNKTTTAYAIEKDLKNINCPADAKTIKKYLETP